MHLTVMPREPLLTRRFGLVFGANFAHALALNLFLHLPGFLKALGASEAEIGLLSGLTGGMGVAARPLLGRIMDARGRSVVAVAGGLVHAGSTAAYLAIDSLGPLIYAVRVAHGVAIAMLFVSLFTLAADIVPASRRIEGFAVFGISGLVPVSLGGLLGDAILRRSGYTHLFLVAIACVIVGVLFSVPLRDGPKPLGEEAGRGILAAFRQRELTPIWVLGLAFAIALASCFVFLKTFVMATGVGSVGLFFSAYTAAALGLRLLFGSLPDRLGPKRVLVPALSVMAIGLALLATPPSVFKVAVSGVLCGIGHAYAFPILMGLVVARARPSDRGASLSIFTALFDGGLLIGGPVLGLLVEGLGYRVMFSVSSGVIVLGLLAFAALDRGRT
jgi:MFS family permease